MSGLLRFASFGLGLAMVSALPAFSASALPAPYVSRALDAVLIAVDDHVRQAFGLAADETGVLVLAVAPDGVAAAAGVEPGDVIGLAHGHAITDPITLDEVVYYWIQKGSFDFGFDGWRAGKAATYATTITLESYSMVIDVTTVSTWSSYSYESFSYSEYTAEYASEISESYESSETTIEETTSSEEFAADETTTEEAATEEASTEEATAEDGATEDATADDGAADEAPADEAPADDAGDEAGGDEVQE